MSNNPDSFFDVPGGALEVKSPHLERRAAWADAVDMAPIRFFNNLTRDLPGDKHVIVELSGGGQGRFHLHITKDGRKFLDAEDCHFNRTFGTMTIAKSRDSEVRVDYLWQRQGVCKVFIDNLFRLCRDLGTTKIDVIAGREDGAYFWSRHGWVLDDNYPFGRFAETVKEGMATLARKYEEEFTDDMRAKIDTIIAGGACTANREICGLPDRIAGVPLGAALFHDHAIRLFLDLSDSDHMEQAEKALSDMTALRQSMTALLPQYARIKA